MMGSKYTLENALAEIETLRTQLKQAVFSDGEYCKELEIQNTKMRRCLMSIRTAIDAYGGGDARRTILYLVNEGLENKD